MKQIFGIVAALAMIVVGFATPASAASKPVIDLRVDEALARFRNDVVGADEIMARSSGVLVFPRVVKAGFVFGGEYGEGALIENGRKSSYYSTASASFGWQIGGQAKTFLIFFMTEEALSNFKLSDGWEVGVDGSVTVATVGAGGSIDTTTTNKPIFAVVFNQKGLMANLTLEGTKISQIHRD